MPEIACPKCSKRLKAPDSAIGKKVKCAGCGEGFVLEPSQPVARTKATERPQEARVIPTAPRFPWVVAAGGCAALVIVVAGLLVLMTRPEAKSRESQEQSAKATASQLAPPVSLATERLKLDQLEIEYAKYCKYVQDKMFDDSLPQDILRAYFLFTNPEARPLLKAYPKELLPEQEKKATEGLKRKAEFEKALKQASSEVRKKYEQEIGPANCKLAAQLSAQRDRVKELEKALDRAEAAQSR